MKFKIDAKSNYTLIQPEGDCLDAKLAEDLRQKIMNLAKENKKSFIVDLSPQFDITLDAESILLDLHHRVYESGLSLAFTNVSAEVLQPIKKEQLHLSLNICPTLVEAIDIITMEGLEREILRES